MIEVSVAARNVEVMATTARMNGGYLRVYNGARPAAPEDPVTTQTLLAELRFSSPAFGNPVNGAAVANPIAPETNVRASSTPTWFRALEADGTTAVLDGSIPADLTPDHAGLIQGGSMAVSSLLYSRV